MGEWMSNSELVLFQYYLAAHCLYQRRSELEKTGIPRIEYISVIQKGTDYNYLELELD
jgi:hypothetical protein